MKQNNKNILIIPLVVFFLTLGMLFSLLMLIENRTYYQNREQFFYIAANQASIIEGCMDTVIARTYTLSAMIDENEGSTEFFDKVAKKVYDEVYKDTGVKLKNIVVAPDGIVEKVYPMVGNEALIGFNFMDTSKKGNKEAVEAFQNGDIVMTAPFELAQGGIGIAARLPVLIDTEGGTKLWGLVSVTFDYDNLIEFFQLSRLKNMGAEYKLWYKTPDGKEAIIQQSDALKKDTVNYDVNVKNMTWYLDVSPTDGWYNRMEIICGALLIIFISASLAYFVFTREHMKRTNIEITEANKKLEHMAIKDNLSSCYSRHYVSSSLLKMPEGTWNNPEVCYSLAIIDIDKFKQINDTYGHDVGDMVITKVAAVLRASCDSQRGDCVIRHGGDEFVVLYNHVNRVELEDILNTLLHNIRAIRLEKYEDIHLTISVGAKISDEKVNKYYDLLKVADEKLYQSKENGRNQFTL